MNLLRMLFVFVIAAPLVLGACSGSSSESQSTPAPAGNPPAQATGGSGGGLSIAGLHFDVPQEWADLGASGMRQAQYTAAAVDGDAEKPEVNVFYFGAAQGGDIEANIRRWVGQMVTAEGGDASSSAVRSKLTTSNGVDVHFVEVDGTYMKSMGGGPMTGGRKKALEGYRMVAAIVSGPQGNVFLKLTGPEKSARAMEEGLRVMVGGAHPDHH